MRRVNCASSSVKETERNSGTHVGSSTRRTMSSCPPAERKAVLGLLHQRVVEDARRDIAAENHRALHQPPPEGHLVFAGMRLDDAFARLVPAARPCALESPPFASARAAQRDLQLSFHSLRSRVVASGRSS